MIGDYVKIHWFIFSFCFGILYIYVMKPERKIVYRFPNPNNIDSLVYKDNSDNCYKFKFEQKNCDSLNNEKIINQPILEDYKNNKKINKNN